MVPCGSWSSSAATRLPVVLVGDTAVAVSWMAVVAILMISPNDDVTDGGNAI